jgi:hypothetical protein
VVALGRAAGDQGRRASGERSRAERRELAQLVPAGPGTEPVVALDPEIARREPERGAEPVGLLERRAPDTQFGAAHDVVMAGHGAVRGLAISFPDGEGAPPPPQGPA